MDEEKKAFFDNLHYSMKEELDSFIEAQLQEQFGGEKLRIHNAMIEQSFVAGNSPAYGTFQSKERALQNTTRAYNHANALITADIEIARRDWQDKIQYQQKLDSLYEFEGGSRKQFLKDYEHWQKAQEPLKTPAPLEKDVTSERTKHDKTNVEITADPNSPRSDFNARSKQDIDKTEELSTGFNKRGQDSMEIESNIGRDID